MPISVTPMDCTSLRQSLVALRTGQESYAQFVNDLCADLETLHCRLLEAEAQLVFQRQQLAELRSPLAEEFQNNVNQQLENNTELQTRVDQLETERKALEEELETIRGRAVNMAEIITGQKRQMSDEHSQWMTELRQLRRILDKQTKWITQQNESTQAALSVSNAARNENGVLGEYFASPAWQTNEVNGAINLPTRQPPPTPQQMPRTSTWHSDPVLGSVLSQFEMLQKDVARRRKQK